MKRKIYMHPSVKPRLNECLAYLDSSLIIPVKDKEKIKKQILKTYDKEDELGESFSLDKKSFCIFMAILNEVEAGNKTKYGDYGFLYEYWNCMNNEKILNKIRYWLLKKNIKIFLLFTKNKKD